MEFSTLGSNPILLVTHHGSSPVGLPYDDLVIEALRPADPRVSFSTTSVPIQDSVANPLDGRLYILLDNDLLHLDDQASKKIIDIELGINGSSLAIDDTQNRLLIGTHDGRILSRSLIDSSEQAELLNWNEDTPVDAITVDNQGIIWFVSDCELHYIAPGQSTLSTTNFCSSDLPESPIDIAVISDTVYIATSESGVRVIEYPALPLTPLESQLPSEAILQEYGKFADFEHHFSVTGS